MPGSLDRRWVAIGAAVMFGLNPVASLLFLVLLLGDGLPATATDPKRRPLLSAADSLPWARWSASRASRPAATSSA